MPRPHRASKESLGAIILYYNAVLLPSADLSSKITAYVQQNCAKIADRYCLAENVLPHVTLCQFQTGKETDFEQSYDFEITPNLTRPNIRKGDSLHEGYYWIELEVEKTPELMKAHNKVYEFLASRNCTVTGKIHNKYYPHLTLCRTQRADFDFDTIPPDILGKHEGWYFAFGKSDINGQFLG